LTEKIPKDLLQGRMDEAFSRFLIKEAGICAIPLSPFYLDDDCKVKKEVTKNTIRFAFCKSKDLLQTAGDKLVRFFTKN
jgi:aspartate/methionine/tyrosine aminotransferase